MHVQVGTSTCEDQKLVNFSTGLPPYSLRQGLSVELRGYTQLISLGGLLWDALAAPSEAPYMSSGISNIGPYASVDKDFIQ